MSTYDENKTPWCFLVLRHDIKWNTMPLIMQYTMYTERLNRCCLKRYMENYKIQIWKRICMRMCAWFYMRHNIISRVLTAEVKLVWHIQSLSHEFHRCCQHTWYDVIIINTLRPRKNGPISLTILAITYLWMKMLEFRWIIHRSLFLRIQLSTIFQHWFRYWLCIGSDNGFAPPRRQAIIWTNDC